MSKLSPVVVSILPGQTDLAEKVAIGLSARHDARPESFQDVTTHLVDVFRSGNPMIVFAAAGIVIRALSPVLGPKKEDAPVVAVSADGTSVVPLLGGHSGANYLAKQVAEITGGIAAITTAGDVTFGVALDAPGENWVLENPLDAKPAMAALIAGNAATLRGCPDWLNALKQLENVKVLAGEDDLSVLEVTGAPPLVYRRRSLALGVGCARGTDPDHVIGFVMKGLSAQGIAASSIASVHSIDLKSDEAAVHALADHLGVPARFHTAERLEQEADRLVHPSEVVFGEVGCHGVSEGAALAAGGPKSELIVPKQKSGSATFAVATIADGGAEGAPRGSLSIIGIGPGDASWRTGEAARLIAEADELVGCSLYLDLLGRSARSKSRTDFDLHHE